MGDFLVCLILTQSYFLRLQVLLRLDRVLYAAYNINLFPFGTTFFTPILENCIRHKGSSTCCGVCMVFTCFFFPMWFVKPFHSSTVENTKCGETGVLHIPTKFGNFWNYLLYRRKVWTPNIFCRLHRCCSCICCSEEMEGSTKGEANGWRECDWLKWSMVFHYMDTYFQV